ncbi:MAG: thiol reductant ABC exporter subunit CydC [Limosilactobacillus mucosae]
MFRQIKLFQILKHDSWVRPFLRRYRKSLILAISLGILTFICAAGLMFSAGYLISRAAEQPVNILLVYVPIVLTRAFGIGRPTLHYAERLVSHNWVLKMTSRLRQRLYDALETDAIFWRRRYQLGDLLGLLADDIGHIQNLYLRTIFPMLVAWGLYVILIIALGWLSPLLGLAVLLIFGLMIIAIPWWSTVVNGARQMKDKQLRDRMYAELTDDVLGLADWRLAGRRADYLKRHAATEKLAMNNRLAEHRFARRRDFLMEMLFLLMAVSLVLWGAARWGQYHGGAADWIAALVLALFPLADALSPLPAAAQETNLYGESLRRLNELPAADQKSAADSHPHAPYQIELRDLHFRYQADDAEVLKGIDLTIKPGEKIAVLGRSGSGKTTLLSLLRGDLLPTGGTVTVGDCLSFELGDAAAEIFGVINQRPYLFNTTIANNLRLGNEEASDEQLKDALVRVGLWEMIDQLPQKMATPVAEAGLRFSGGERHRLALARILLHNAPIVLLDEPTVGLDPITERQVIETFQTQLQDRTLIWVTHHLQGVEQMDRVILIGDGQLKLQGTPAELWQQSAYYRGLLTADQGGTSQAGK